METALFWIVWGIISFWALKTFYFSFSKEKIEQLRKAALGFHLAIFILAFLPWLSPALGGTSGVALALTGNILAIFFLTLVTLSTIAFLTKEALLIKVAAGMVLTNTFALFALMYSLRSTPFTLTLYDLAPIIAFLVLLICDVTVLLLWQQMQLKEKGVKKKTPKVNRIIIFVSIAIFTLLGLFVFGIKGDNGQKGINLVLQLQEVQEFKKAVEENGRSKFSIAVDRQDELYSVIKVFEAFPDHITTFNWYRVDKRTGKVEKQDIATDSWEEVGN